MLLSKSSSKLFPKCFYISKYITYSTGSSAADVYKKYADTLALPNTPFKTRASPNDIQRYIKQTGQELYSWQSENLPCDRTIVFHDGPPYANGELHLGHALNKILKDIINRYHIIKGDRVNYIPGWDCHGLPNELAAMEKAKKKHGSTEVNKYSIQKRRELAHQHAMEMSLKQKEAFEGFAVMADWENKNNTNIYRTLTNDYVIRQLKVFQKMVQKGLISRQERPVYWSVESGTALAESELQYGEHNTQTVVVKYQLSEVNPELRQLLLKNGISDLVSIAIWTTTPWTLVANLAVAINPEIEYGIVLSPDHGYIITSVERYSEIPDGAETGITFKGELLLNSTYKCPIRNNSTQYPILPANYVTSSSGTGLVHSAPGHGKEDYLMCKEHGILPFSPIDNYGRYTSDLDQNLPSLVGFNARKEGQLAVLDMLDKSQSIISKSVIKHNIPFDWRSKTPVMVRSTPQFFADVGSIKEHALESLQNVTFYPESGRNRLTAFTISRSEWCISRQRVWGVPIPVLYHKESGAALMNNETIEYIIKTIENEGDDGLSKWFNDDHTDIKHWLPEKYHSQADDYRRGTETMDVWFDSGTSWTMLPDKANESPADYYLEGSDQHRGWFQSSLLTKIAVSDKYPALAPFKNVVTHGFVLDAKGQKMSKSLKNVVTPEELVKGNNKKNITNLGIDGMRLWISQSDYTSDISLSPVIINQVASLVKKLRISYKFLLGNLDKQVQFPSYDELRPVDRRALSSLYQLSNEIEQDYDSLSFNRVVKRIQNHLSTELSAFYFDIVKDRLYADSKDSLERRSIQYVLAQVLHVYVSVLSPITPLLSQEVWDSCPEYITKGQDSPFKSGWFNIPKEWYNKQLDDDFAVLIEIRGLITGAMEEGRIARNIRSSLGTTVYINVEKDSPVYEKVIEYQNYLEELFITSKVYINEGIPDVSWKYTADNSKVKVTVTPPTLEKCPRCWQFTAKEDGELCNRCDDVVHHH